MLRSKLANFIVKRVLIWFILLSIIDIVFLEQRWYLLIGLFLGGIFSISKLGSFMWVFGRIISLNSAESSKKLGVGGSIAAFVINQILLLPFLYLAYKYNNWFFIGFVSGILFVPFVIILNCLTETLGITNNSFE